MKEVLILTGGSSGIGLGIAKAFRSKGVEVFSIARTINLELTKLGVTQIKLDLTQTSKIEHCMLHIFKQLDKESIIKITLINNAGMMGKIARLEEVPLQDIQNTISLNTLAPMMCSQVFIQQTKNWDIDKIIINITSGAAQKPYDGWSAYCSSKAAINMLTQVIATEQSYAKNGVKVLAIAPGVVDTAMQDQIRQSKEEDFKSLARFVALKNEGNLANIEDVGKKIYEISQQKKMISGSILRIE